MDRNTLKKYVGNMEQLASVRSYTVNEGLMNGIKMHHFDAGALTFTVMESRGMDILDMRYKGVPLNFLSKCGAMAREHVDPVGMNFLRGISGGMLYTCGLNNVGDQYESENGIDYFHGRMRLLPAEKVSVTQDWDENGYKLGVSGRMRQAGLFRENMVLRRSIETYMGGKSVIIRNEVVNEGVHTEPVMIMFHVNTGYPLLDEKAELAIPSRKVYCMNKRAEETSDSWNRTAEPNDDEVEMVFVHDVGADEEGMTHAFLYNNDLELGLGLSFSTETLPHLLQWKSTGSTDYVMGLQPTNCFAAGRAYEERQGTLKTIEPGEHMHFDLCLTVLDGREDKEKFAEKLKLCEK